MDALAASEAEFRLLAESSSDMVTRVDAEGRMTYISPAADVSLDGNPQNSWAEASTTGSMKVTSKR